jgi:hypothetical protein
MDPHYLISQVDNYIQHRKYSYLIRMRPYLQNYGTCGTCCVLPILEKIGKTPTIQLEREIWDRVGKPYNFPGGMAKILIENNFKPVYYQYPAEPFTLNHEDILSQNPFLYKKIQEYINLHQEAVSMGMDVVIQDWGYEDIHIQLEHGNVCILGIHIPSSDVLHWIIVRGYRGNRLEVIDPLKQIRSIYEYEMEGLINTSMGKRLLVIKKFPEELLKNLGKS